MMEAIITFLSNLDSKQLIVLGAIGVTVVVVLLLMVAQIARTHCFRTRSTDTPSLDVEVATVTPTAAAVALVHVAVQTPPPSRRAHAILAPPPSVPSTHAFLRECSAARLQGSLPRYMKEQFKLARRQAAQQNRGSTMMHE